MGSSVQENKKTSKNLWIIGLIILLIIATIVGYISFRFKDSNIYPNISIGDVEVGGLVPKEARARLEEVYSESLDSFFVELIYETNSWKLDAEDLGLSYTFDEYVQEAYGIGRTDGFFYKIKSLLSLKKDPVNIDIKPYYDTLKLDQNINEMASAINKSKEDANLVRRNGQFVILKEVTGIEMETYALKESIISSIESLHNAKINIPVNRFEPEVTEEQLRHIGGLIGDYSTTFKSEEKGRTENIKIAVKSINGNLLMPGEVFSFNESTGPRGVEEGYKEAPVIINGQLVPGIGGGICQVSTTLYQAVVRADIEVVERRNHGLPVGYVPIGQDATVAYGYIDFKFKNNKEYPIYIESYIVDNQVYVKLHSKKTSDISIALNSEVVQVVEPKMQIKKDEGLAIGESKVDKEGKKGYRVVTYKIYTDKGKEVKREIITKDYYPPRDGIILEGTGR